MFDKFKQDEAKHTCPRRIENGMHSASSPMRGAGENLDTYKEGRGLVGQPRGCTYCGSMSPEDFLEAVKNKAEIGPTDKSYKLYIDDHKGKFYTQHLSPEQGHAFYQMMQANEVNWGYPGYPYVPLYLPGPSTDPKTEGEES